MIASTISLSPLTTLNTPSGRPAALNSAPSRTGRLGSRSDGLQDEGVAGGNGDAGHPHRDHRREIERRDAGADADRLAMRENIDPRAGAMGIFTLQHMRDAAAEFDDFKAALDIALRISEHLAVFGRQDARQIVDLGFDQLLELEHHPGAALRIGRGPGRLRLAGSGNRLVERRRVTQCYTRLHLARIGIKNVAAASARGDRLAGDEVIYAAHGLLYRRAASLATCDFSGSLGPPGLGPG